MTTDNLGSELREMRKQIQEMQMNGSEKDTEIIKLNMHLADEKKKTQDFIRSQKLQQTKQSDYGSPVRDNDKTSQDLRQQLSQVQDDNEQFKQENKQLKKKVEYQKKQTLQEVQSNKSLKKDIKELESRLMSTPQSQSLQELEQKYITKINSVKAQMKENETKLREEFSIEKNKLKVEKEDMQTQVKKALKIHKENEKLLQRAEQHK